MMRMSLRRLSLKRRVWIAIALTTFLPVIVLIYYLADFKIMPFTLGILLAIVALGWWIIFEVFRSIVRIYDESKNCLPRERAKDILDPPYMTNEMERLGSIFNILSSQVKESVEELKLVSTKTEELNKAINQKVGILSSILEANILFSKGGSERDIIQFLTERLKDIIEVNTVFSLLRKEGDEKYDIFFSGTEQAKIDALMAHKEFGSLVKVSHRIVIDARGLFDQFSFLKDILDIKNMIINPIYLREQVIGLVIVANYSQNFVFTSDDLETIELFSRNISIVHEHERLAKKVEDLEMFDPLTRVYNKRFFTNRLEEEVHRAITYQRPCGFLTVEIGNYNEYHENFGLIEIERILQEIVKIFRNYIKPIDILGRIKDNRIGAILLERNKRQTYYAGERIQEAILAFLKDIDKETVPDIRFAVAENPIDGVDASQLFAHIESQLKAR